MEMASNRWALDALGRPRQQSGQFTIRKIYTYSHRLQQRGNTIQLTWVPLLKEGFWLGKMAKTEAQEAVEREVTPVTQTYQAKSTALRLAVDEKRYSNRLPENVGKYSRRIDKALPGKHTRALYDVLKKRESKVPVQLYKGTARLNGLLHRIGAAESDLCNCGRAGEHVEHFLFRCEKWKEEREVMSKGSRSKMGNLPFFLGSKTAADDDKWKPDMRAIQAIIRFAITTRRLDADPRRPMD